MASASRLQNLAGHLSRPAASTVTEPPADDALHPSPSTNGRAGGSIPPDNSEAFPVFGGDYEVDAGFVQRFVTEVCDHRSSFCTGLVIYYSFARDDVPGLRGHPAEHCRWS